MTERETLKSDKAIAKAEIKAKPKSGLRENIEAIVIAVILAMFIRTFIVQAFKIPSGSMKDTLLIGDHILVNKFIYGVKLPFIDKTIIPVKDPKSGDIIVFRFPEEPEKDFIKRAIAVAGDTVEVRGKKVFVNGERFEDLYGVFKDPHIINGSPRDFFGPVKVPEGHVFVMGDNRDHSYDSRFWGFVKLKSVRGKAFIIYWSWDKENFPGGTHWFSIWKWIRWGRMGDILH